jgi:hypothetical protein
MTVEPVDLDFFARTTSLLAENIIIFTFDAKTGRPDRPMMPA